MSFSPEPSNPAVCEYISRLLHTLLITAQRQNPKLLTEYCQGWLEVASPEIQRAKITALLQQQTDIPRLFKAIDHILKKFLISDFHGSKAHGQVLERIQGLIRSKADQCTAPDATPHTLNGGDSRNVLNTEFLGLLLVDAENINLTEGLEDYLQTLAQYPIRHRLAFGNWRKLGGRDQEFYQRGYQMVHVPSGKNSTDIKMSLDGSLIPLWKPSIREVFICSTDTDFLHLGHTLLNLGVTPYRVSRHQDSFAISNVASQKNYVFNLLHADENTINIAPHSEHLVTANVDGNNAATAMIEPVKTPTIDQMTRWLKILILQDQQANPEQLITISRLGKLFRDRNQISANQVLRVNSNYKTLKQFLSAHPAFELLALPNGQHIEVRLKALPLEQDSTTLETSQDTSGTTTHSITNAQALEQALVKLVWSLSSSQASNQVCLAVLGSHFAKVHQEPLSKVLKRIGEPKGLPKFFAKCNSLRIQKHGNDWRVALVCVS